jgi:hypothetical protein
MKRAAGRLTFLCCIPHLVAAHNYIEAHTAFYSPSRPGRMLHPSSPCCF